MPHIRLIDPDDAEGLLAEEYDAAVEFASLIAVHTRSPMIAPPSSLYTPRQLMTGLAPRRS